MCDHSFVDRAEHGRRKKSDRNIRDRTSSWIMRSGPAFRQMLWANDVQPQPGTGGPQTSQPTILLHFKHKVMHSVSVISGAGPPIGPDLHASIALDITQKSVPFIAFALSLSLSLRPRLFLVCPIFLFLSED